MDAAVRKRSGNRVDMPLPGKSANKKRKFRLTGPGILLLIILGFIFYSFAGQMVEMYNVQQEIQDIHKQMQDLESKNSDLRKQIDNLNSDAYIEREAREKLGLVKPGEKIILEAKVGPGGSSIPTVPQDPQKIEVH